METLGIMVIKMVSLLIKEVAVILYMSVCFRVLLTVVAVLSSYSIHLLLKSSGIVGMYVA